MMTALLNMATRIGMVMCTEKFITRLVVIGMQALAKKTSNTVDDELVGLVVDGLDESKLPEARKV